MAVWKKSLVFLGSLAVFGGMMNWVVMPWYVGHNALVKVPSVVGMSFDDARKTLDGSGLEGKEGDIRYDPSKPIGTVLDQNPTPDQMVKNGRRIYLVISGGEQLYDVPNLVGRTVREAKFSLGLRNLEIQEMDSKQTAQYPTGTIISQLEQPGAKVKKGTKIGVVVAVGLEIGNLKVPDLIGKSLDDAKKLIMQNKLMVGKITFQPSTNVPLNAVIDQYPKGSTMAQENQKIDLFVNKEVKKVEEKEQEINSMDEVKDDNSKIDKSKDKDADKEKKEDLKKDDKKKDDKSTNPLDKKDDKSKSPDNSKEPKKKDDTKPDKNKNQDNGDDHF